MSQPSKRPVSDLVKVVRELAQNAPDNKYNRGDNVYCSFNKGLCTNGTVGCIIGQGLRKLEMKADDKRGLSKIMIEDFVCVDNRPGNELLWCDLVQFEQDCGSTWSKAVKVADEQYGEFFNETTPILYGFLD